MQYKVFSQRKSSLVVLLNGVVAVVLQICCTIEKFIECPFHGVVRRLYIVANPIEENLLQWISVVKIANM